MGKAQIYAARCGHAISDSLYDHYLEMMPSGIRSSIERYRRWQDRQATLFGKVLLLKALQQQFHDTGLRKFQSLELSDFGKPFIEGGPEFNISHSEDIVVLALTQHQGIGIDIEKIRPVDKDDFAGELPEIISFYENHEAEQANHLFFEWGLIGHYSRGVYRALYMGWRRYLDSIFFLFFREKSLTTFRHNVFCVATLRQRETETKSEDDQTRWTSSAY